jgi:nitroreductase
MDVSDQPGLYDGLCTTRAIRRYRPDPIPDDDVAAMLFAATRAPSGSNRQPFRFLALRDGPKATEAKALLGRSFRDMWATKRAADGYDEGSGTGEDTPKARMARTMQAFVDDFERTPLVVLAGLYRYRDDVYLGASVYPACQNLLLSARALGYGGVMTIWHAMVEAELRELLGIPEDVFLAATLAIGKPQGHHGPVRRKPLAELAFVDSWGEGADWLVDPPGTAHAGGPRR